MGAMKRRSAEGLREKSVCGKGRGNVYANPEPAALGGIHTQSGAGSQSSDDSNDTVVSARRGQRSCGVHAGASWGSKGDVSWLAERA